MFAFSTRNQRLKDCLSTVFGTDIMGYIIITVLLFMVVGIATLFFFEAVIPPDMIDQKYTHALDPLNFILSFIYLRLWTEAFEGYSSSPRLYRSLCFKIVTISDKFFSFHKKPNENIQYIVVMKEALIACIVFGYKIFAGNDTEHITNSLKEECYEFGMGPIVEMIEKHEKKGPEFDPIAMIRDILKLVNLCIRHAEDHKHLREGDISVISKEIKEVYTKLEEIDSSFNIREPPIFNTHNVLTLFIYFAIWQPFVMWITLGFWPTVVSYPIVMFLLIGVVIYRSWLSDAFDPKRPMKLHNYAAWRRYFIESICENFTLEIVIDANGSRKDDITDIKPRNRKNRGQRLMPINVDLTKLGPMSDQYDGYSSGEDDGRKRDPLSQQPNNQGIADFLLQGNPYTSTPNK